MVLLQFASLAIRKLAVKPCYLFIDTDDTALPRNPRKGTVTSSLPPTILIISNNIINNTIKNNIDINIVITGDQHFYLFWGIYV